LNYSFDLFIILFRFIIVIKMNYLFSISITSQIYKFVSIQRIVRTPKKTHI